MYCMSFPFKQTRALQLLTYLEKVTQGYTQPPEDISVLSLQHKLNFLLQEKWARVTEAQAREGSSPMLKAPSGAEEQD